MSKLLVRIVVLVAVALFGVSVPVYADKYNAICDPESPNYANLADDVKQDICGGTVNDNRSLMDVVQTVINIALTVLGIVAVFVLVIAGQRYITAQGDPGKLKMAKDMIVWGLIGLVVALLAYAIVNFIVMAAPGETV